ncbi:hypothetical protein [Metabacillus elymi]|uniref:Uncharacterized protein n=1 Tax=Metabacillus elymi TaxID=2745198 RepID=A0ABX6S586_9BACI|nr:hypothetical protein [Metabacillus sp. KUDC1714]QNF28021.1 hypothetical protein HUW50_11370 [Metabacillus sp. KUDC1714]
MNSKYKLYVDEILKTWQEKLREGAFKLINKYGYPDEASASKLIWYNNGDWKRTIAHRDAITYLLSNNQSNFLEQTFEYMHSLDEMKIDNENIYVNSTNKEITIFGEKEEVNLISLNILLEKDKESYKSKSQKVL